MSRLGRALRRLRHHRHGAVAAGRNQIERLAGERVAGAVDTTSTTGEAPVTVRVSRTAPMPIGTLTVATKPVVSRIPSRRTDWNPDKSYTTLKTPIGNGVRRYSPRSLVTADTEGTCNEGLVAVTVTPGRAAPLVGHHTDDARFLLRR